MKTFRIGAFEISALLELECPAFGATDLFPDLTDEYCRDARNRLGHDYITDDGKLVMAFRTFVVRTGRLNILIDTCIGNHKERPERPLFHRMNTPYLENLAAIGLKPEEIDIVMCTHLHWDHVGWNTRLVDGTWVPTFQNARYVIAKTEYEYWDNIYRTQPDGRHAQAFADSILPVHRAGKTVLVDDSFEIQDGIWLEPCLGHTIGTVVVNAKSGDRTGAFCGDVLQHPVQLLYPEMSSRPDYDQAQSRTSRRAFLENHADTGHLIMPTHFPYHPAVTVDRDGKAYKMSAV